MDEEIQQLCNFFNLLNKKKENLPIKVHIVLDEKEIFEDIQNYNRFVRKYGLTGGWDDIDHSVYVNLRQKYDLQNVIYHLRRNFPGRISLWSSSINSQKQFTTDINEEEIIEHDKWYKEYIRLKTLRQRAFKYYNSKKKDNENTSRPQTASSNMSISSYSSERIQKQRNDLKIKIQKWKEYKEQMKKNEEKSNALKNKEVAEKEKMRKMMQENKRKSVMEYRSEKIQIQKAMWMAKLTEEKNKIKIKRKKADQMLPLFRRKDKQIIHKLQDRRESLERKREEQQQLLEKLISKYRKTLNVERDPHRLLETTVEWRQKLLKGEDERDNYNLFAEPQDITQIPHLAIPSWRKNIH